MTKYVISFFNNVIGLLLRHNDRLTIGMRNDVRWWGLRGLNRRGKLLIGSDSILRCRIDFDSAAGYVEIGDRCYLGASHLVCHSNISIGDDVIISWGVTIVDHDSHSLEWLCRSQDVGDWMRGNKCWDCVTIRPIKIGNKSWIGFGASILKGVSIGEGAIIGANSVVTRDVPAYSVVVGNPARVVRNLKGR